MSEAQLLALITMFFMGLMATLPLIGAEMARWKQMALAALAALLMGPGIVHLVIKGVLG